MEEIWPNPETDVDPTQLYEVDRYESIQKLLDKNNRPWLTLNMISSLDGSATSGGLSGDLGSMGDKMIFSALRAATDFILVAANTARLEKYGPPTSSEEVVERRLARGQNKTPRLAIVSRSLNFGVDSKFLDPNSTPIIYTTTNSPTEKKSELEKSVEIREAGKDDVDLNRVLKELGAEGKMILAEGGPSLNGQLLQHDLLDEMCLTLSPRIIGESGPRIVSNNVTNSVTGDITNNDYSKNMELQRVLRDEESMLYLRLIKK